VLRAARETVSPFLKKGKMYDSTQLKTGLIGLVGWRQNADSDGWQLTDLTSTTSGLYFNDVHPLLTFDNLASIAPRFDQTEDTPTAINEAFTAWLKQKTEAGILQTVQDWLGEKFETLTANNLLERKTLFVTTGNLADVQAKTGRLVGLEIVTGREPSIAVKLKTINLQLSANQSLTLNLYQNGQSAPVETVTINYTGSGSIQTETVNWTLTGGKTYWLAYHEEDLSGQSINGVRNYDFCDRGLTRFPAGRYAQIAAFNADVSNGALWDLAATNYTVSTNYGINLDFDVRCDYTPFILDQKDLFQTAISLRVALNLLREMAFNANARINRNEANIEQGTILYEIEGDTQGRPGMSVAGQYAKALKAIAFDTTGIEKVCLPCRRRGTRTKAIGPAPSSWPWL